MKSKIKSLLFRVQNKLKPEVVIPHYDEKRKLLLSYQRQLDIKYFVETGTFLGDTVEFFKRKFDKVYSIELSEELAAKCKHRFSNDANVTIIQGDSGEVLSELVKEITSPALFWLDGHYSSEFFVGEEFIKTAKGEKDTPIIKELNVLLNSKLQHVILIDDARLFNGQGDYPTVNKIRAVVRKSPHKFKVFIEKDIINIIPSA